MFGGWQPGAGFYHPDSGSGTATRRPGPSAQLSGTQPTPRFGALDRLGRGAQPRRAVRWLRRGRRAAERHLGVGQRTRPGPTGRPPARSPRRATRAAGLRLRSAQDGPLRRQHGHRRRRPRAPRSTRPGSGTGPRGRGRSITTTGRDQHVLLAAATRARATTPAAQDRPLPLLPTTSGSTTPGTAGTGTWADAAPVRPRSTPPFRRTTTRGWSTTPGARCWSSSAGILRALPCGSSTPRTTRGQPVGARQRPAPAPVPVARVRQQGGKLMVFGGRSAPTASTSRTSGSGRGPTPR